MFLVFEVDAIPDLESLCGAIKVFLFESVELDDGGVPCDDFDLVAF